MSNQLIQSSKEMAAKLPIYDSFCFFKTYTNKDGKIIKQPISGTGKEGVKITSPEHKSLLVELDDVENNPPPGGKYAGIAFYKGMPLTPNGNMLVCLDIDTKEASTPSKAANDLVDWARKNGHLYEKSHSGKGGHIFIATEPGVKLPKNIPLDVDGAELELFHPESIKCLMLTGANMSGEFIDQPINLANELSKIGIHLKAPLIDGENALTLDAISNKCLDNLDRSSGEIINITNPSTADVNQLALKNVDLWVKDVFPSAISRGPEGWRISSESLGRNLEEDISIHPEGIKDFGVHDMGDHRQGKRTPIELVAEHKFGNINQWQEATDWLREKLGLPSFRASIPNDLNDDAGVAVAKEPKRFNLDIVPPSKIIKAQEFILNRLVSGGLVVLAAAPGGGKTTALIALAMRAAGFIKDDIHYELTRKIIIFTEHSTQVEEIIMAMVTSGACPVSYEEARERLIIVNAKRLDIYSVKICAEFIDINDYSIMNYKGEKSYLAKPLVIFDTTNANFDLENENDSQVVGRFMAEIKNQFYVNRGIHVLLSGHTSKALKHGEADSMSARGSGAYEGDAYQVIYITVNGKDRFLEIAAPKHRFHALTDSIQLISNVGMVTALDVFGDEISYPVTYIENFQHLSKEEKSNVKEKAKEERNLASKIHRENAIRAEILDLMAAWPSLNQAKSDVVIPTKRAILDKCSGDTSSISDVFDSLLSEGHILGIDITNDHKNIIKNTIGKAPHNNQKTYYWQRIREDEFI